MLRSADWQDQRSQPATNNPYRGGFPLKAGPLLPHSPKSQYQEKVLEESLGKREGRRAVPIQPPATDSQDSESKLPAETRAQAHSGLHH